MCWQAHLPIILPGENSLTDRFASPVTLELLDQPYALRLGNENSLIRERLCDELYRGVEIAGFREGGCEGLANGGEYRLTRLIDRACDS